MYKLPKIKLPKISLEKSRPTKPQSSSRLLVFAIIISLFGGFLGGAFFNTFLYSDIRGYLQLLNIDPLQQQIFEKETLETQYFSQETAVVNAVKQSSPSVVSIIVTKDLPIFEQYYLDPFQDFEEFFGEDFGYRIPQYRQKGTEQKEIGGGTGFIVSEDGMILTNKHVVADQDASYTVLTNNGLKFEAKALARDPLQDIAILKIETDQDLPVLKLGDSDELEIGQTVIAIGNVLGEFRNSISVGVISGLGRTIAASGGGTTEILEGIIQTDAAINKGNSGGPLLNLRGEVIGMNTAMASGAENVGFAIPANQAKRDIQQIKEFGEIVYPFLGIYYTIITPEFKKEYDLSVDYGAWVGRDRNGNETDIAVFSDSAADKAGLQRNDIVLEFAGEKITLENSLAKIMLKYNPGETVILKILRDSKTETIQVTLGKRSE